MNGEAAVASYPSQTLAAAASVVSVERGQHLVNGGVAAGGTSRPKRAPRHNLHGGSGNDVN